MSAPAVLGADRSVPGLAAAMNRDTFIAMLTEHLPECREGMTILDARAVDVQYAPAESARVLWKVNVEEPHSGRVCRQLVFAKALGGDQSAPAPPLDLIRRYTMLRDQKRMWREMPLRTPWLFVERAHVLIHAFPLDPLLPGLLDVANPDAMKEALNRAWKPRGVRVRRVRIDTLSYTPEARGALRYEVLSQDRVSGIPELRRLVGKVDARRSPARLFAGHWAVWRRTFGRVAVAPPVGYVAVSGLSLQEFLTGTRLTDLAGQGAFIGYIREAARAIANVHALTLPLLSTRGVDKEMSTVDRWIGVLTRIRPKEAPRLHALGGRLRTEVAQRLRISGTVHGDFHLANVLADDDGVTLIDWDQVAHGDPMVDVGRVLASLRVSSLRLTGTHDAFAAIAENFLRTYLDTTHQDERRARLFEAVALLVAAAAPFRLQRAGWDESAELMIAEAERALQRSLAGPAIAAGGGDAAAHDVPFEERRPWALDRTYAQALLVPVVHDLHGRDVEVTECEPEALAERTGRIDVRWSLNGYRGNQSWRETFHGAGFARDSGHGRLRRLELATAALAAHASALRLPRPCGYLAPLSMMVIQPAPGEPLIKLLDTHMGADAVATTARALASLHALSIDLERQRATGRELVSIRRRLVRLAGQSHPEEPRASALLMEVERFILTLGERRAPTVRDIDLSDIRVDGDSAGVAAITDVMCAEPLTSAGEMIAQLTVRAHEQTSPASAASQFFDAYVSASGCNGEQLRAFTALALLSHACRVGAERPGDTLPALLVADASAMWSLGR